MLIRELMRLLKHTAEAELSESPGFVEQLNRNDHDTSLILYITWK